MGFSDAIYWTLKIFFSMLWLIYVLSLYFYWSGEFMWHLTGIASIIYFIINVRWQMSRRTPINN